MSTPITTASPAGSRGWLRTLLPGGFIDAREARGRRDRVVDAVMYLGAFGIGAATLADTWSLHPTWLRVIAIVVGLASVASLRWRRDHPEALGIVIGLLSLVILSVSGVALVATFNATIRARVGAVAAVAGLSVAWAFINPALYPTVDYGRDVAASLLLSAVVFGWGLFVRARRELVRSMLAQGARAVDDAREMERRRIAREMHDVLAHRLSLLSVHAGALEFNAGASPETVAEAAGVIRQSARVALDELRDVIGVLREDESERLTAPPQPTLDQLGDLVEESRAAGMRITASIEPGSAPTTAAVGRTVYRVVQEGLTNARKHAPGAAVSVVVAAADAQVVVEVRCLAPVAVGASPGLPGSGTGLIGLTERVSLIGGTLEHGVDDDGAFVVRARLPR